MSSSISRDMINAANAGTKCDMKGHAESSSLSCLYRLYHICPLTGLQRRSKTLPPPTKAQTLGRHIQLPQTRTIKPSSLPSSFSYHCRAFNNHRQEPAEYFRIAKPRRNMRSGQEP
uniref:Zinc finger protein n=1 Tax=Loa loa TaxID=7209 RepID=A0A1I7VCB6_LOALO